MVDTSEIKRGMTIRIIRMDGEPNYTNAIGKVVWIDGIGQIHGTWGGCAIIPGLDEFEIIDGAN